MEMSRKWCMPSSDTFSMKPVKLLLERWIKSDYIIIDPFARNSTIATYSNDLNPETSAQYHMDAVDFCEMLKSKNIVADLVLVDPPYSNRQITECYQSIGKKATMQDTQNASLYKRVRDSLDLILKIDGIAISFGWNSGGFGKKRGYLAEEIMIINHGSAHNDTIVTVERKC